MIFLYRTLLAFLVLFCCSLQSQAQQNNPSLISGNFQSATFEEFARQVEAQTGYHFYFDAAAVDSLSITLKVQEQALPAVLRQAFAGTDFQFAIDARQQVFVSKGRQLSVALPKGFFEREEATAEGESQLAGVQLRAEEKVTKKAAGSELKLYEIGIKREGATGKANIAGHLRDAKTGEAIIGAAVFVESPTIGTISDEFGYYSLTLPLGRHELKVKAIGLQNTRRQIMLHSNGKLDIEIAEDVRTLKEVLVEAEKDKNVSGLQMGVEKLDIRTIKQVPTAFGEVDILRVVLTLPGVKSVGEGSTGMNVRGGSTDQNLVLFNDATIYNPSHLFGFFSAFNPDILKTVELYKSGIPAKYGGRLSSVLEVTSREGNKKKISGAGGIGLLTSRLTLEGPIKTDKTSFLIGGRSTYSDWLLKKIPNKTYSQSTASFYDLNAHISHEVNDKNTLYLNGYLSKDRFQLGSDTLYRFTNQAASLKWKHIFQNKLYGVFTGVYSHYDYDMASDKNPVTASKLTFGIDQSNLQADFSYFPTSKHTVDFGASSILYNVNSGTLTPNSAESLVMPDKLQTERAVESALYVSDRYDITPRLSVLVGLRYSFFNAMGPRTVNQYAPGVPKTEGTIQDTAVYGAGDSFATYHGPEYRLSARYSLNDNSSVKLSFNRLRQYIHMLSNTTSMSPTDVWKLSDSNIKPQVGDQVALGYYRNFRANTVELSVEGYYKWMQDFLDYKSGASLIMNHHIETDVASAEGKAYGVEVMLKKATGKLNGWVSYTYSRTLVRVDDAQTGEKINGGNFYPSNFDKPHDFTMISNYRFSQRFSTSLNFTYSTGRPITLPIAKYTMGNSQRIYYSDRNAYRVPDYLRMDLALNIEGNHKIKKLAHSSWTLAVYNLTGRKNPYSIYFKSEEGRIRGYKMSIFGQPIPTITYNFKF
ncbi:TonB-dependent receptor [Pontibacter akesuensis]|uniref:TonB-dependent Receptor Plug Domain n=1 Tax=Pontibacter akesuensis TaxID=388950 RepID=A0A1I7KMQ4_9BACT|nr:TonB-dependent receptor [Pontibacter akesuensis]GHA77563.1 TonB-dependent receptor [Pontibacter akesuensis]SFU98634.1 TonB-dependent Receptor Plug Domain [Pontibacter akesuensis]